MLQQLHQDSVWLGENCEVPCTVLFVDLYFSHKVDVFTDLSPEAGTRSNEQV